MIASLIIEACAAHYRLSPEDVLGRRRFANVVRARHLAIYFCRVNGFSWRQIGDAFGLDNASAIHAYRSIFRAKAEDYWLRASIDKLTEQIGGVREAS